MPAGEKKDQNQPGTPNPLEEDTLLILKKAADRASDSFCEHDENPRACRICLQEKHEAELEKLREQRRDNPEYFLTRFRVPKHYLNSRLDDFKGYTKTVDFLKKYPEQPISLFFTGPVGTGKTHLAVATLREMLMGGFVDRALFVTAPELLLKIRKSFQDGESLSEEEIIDRYAEYPFMILDDLGAEKVSDWTVQAFYLILDRRNRELLPTLVTSNLSLDEMEAQLSPRIASRLADSKIIRLTGQDYRRKRE